MNHNDLMIISCDWSVKDNDNESNSQLNINIIINIKGCDWSVKDNDDLSFASDLGRRL